VCALEVDVGISVREAGYVEPESISLVVDLKHRLSVFDGDHHVEVGSCIVGLVLDCSPTVGCVCLSCQLPCFRSGNPASLLCLRTSSTEIHTPADLKNKDKEPESVCVSR
jgi:hypothetical protein